jgi:hypothetical protein
MWKEILTAFKNAFFEIPIMITSKITWCIKNFLLQLGNHLATRTVKITEQTCKVKNLPQDLGITI